MLPELPILVESVKATGNIAEARFVTFAGAQVATANVIAQGVSRMAVSTGEMCPLGTIGVFEVETGGAFDPGDYISTDSQGRAVERTSTNIILGVARSTSSGAGSRALVFLNTTPATA